MRLKKIIRLFSICLLYNVFFPVASTAQVRPGVYLLPNEGGVGVGEKLQMVVVDVPRTGLHRFATRVRGLEQHFTVSWKSSSNSIATVNLGSLTSVSVHA